MRLRHAVLILTVLFGTFRFLGADSTDPAIDPNLTAKARTLAADPSVAADWQQLKGRWERQQSLPDGTDLRVEKTISNQHEVVRVYAPDGTLMREQQADLTIERRGNLRVLSWSNAVVTAGADQGATVDDGTAVITFKDGRFISVCGLATDEQWSVYTEVWTRLPEVVRPT